MPNTETVTESKRPLGKRATVAANAAAGKLPDAPNFSAKSHQRFRAKLDAVAKMVRAKDTEGLRAFEHKGYLGSSMKAVLRYRDLALTALEAKAAKKAEREAKKNGN